jgi:hypothetical protein
MVAAQKLSNPAQLEECVRTTQDIFKKEDGAYAKTVVANLVAMGFQTRTGLIPAGKYGVPQASAHSLFCSCVLAHAVALQPLGMNDFALA